VSATVSWGSSSRRNRRILNWGEESIRERE
jgi:hypothetical protein